jgi:uncharacterized protein involved in exopolysaccharide biosynthesis
MPRADETSTVIPETRADGGTDGDWVELTLPLLRNLRWLVFVPLLAAALAVAVSYALPSRFTAQTSFLPPQQQQSAASSALASLGTLAGIAGGAAGLRSAADQYVALLQSVTVADRIVDAFELKRVYDEELRVDTRRKLETRVRISSNKKDGLIYIEVDDEDPARAASMANRYVDELRRVTAELAITEAQQRRQFFQKQLEQTKQRLAAAQLALQQSGVDQGVLRAEPRAAAEAYARLRAEMTAAEMRLAALRGNLTEDAPEVRTQQGVVGALRAQLAKTEQPRAEGGGADFISRFREFKYQETLLELFARQFELARVDEAREGALIQVVDPAAPPERKSWPKRGIVAVATFLVVLLLFAAGLLLRALWERSSQNPQEAQRWSRVAKALGRESR